jgi:alkaline phosphatase D
VTAAGNNQINEAAISTRRELLRDGAAAGTGLALWATTPGWARARPTGLSRGGAFRQGIAAGLPGPHGIALWTRIEGLEEAARMRLEIATDRGFRHVVHSRRVQTNPRADQTVKVAIRSPVLRADETYYYRFQTASEHSPVGRFRTLPPPDSNRPLRIGLFGCQSYTEGFWPSHRALAAEDDLDLVICLGDYIYEYGRGVTNVRNDTIGGGEARSLADYRAKFLLYRSDPLLRNVHSKHAMMFLWDDHEVVNDYWREGQEGAVRAGFAERRANAYRAWFEHQPIPRVRPGSSRVYRSMRIGTVAELLFLDERQYRDAQPCDDRFLAPCPTKDEPGRTMLGPAQKAWLKDRLVASRAAWKVLVNGVMMMGQDLPVPGSVAWPDVWDGYGAERKEIVSFWLGKGVKDVLVITGDDHDNYAGTVTTTGHIDGRPGAIEFVVPSISSDNNTEYLGGAGVVGEGLARLNNPHFKMVDWVRHGYCVLELDRREARIDYRHVASKLDPKSPTSTTYRFRVPRGKVELSAA